MSKEIQKKKKKECRDGGISRAATTTAVREGLAKMSISKGGEEMLTDNRAGDMHQREPDIAAKEETMKLEDGEISDMQLDSEGEDIVELDCDSDCVITEVIEAKREPINDDHIIGGASGDNGTMHRKRSHEAQSNQMWKKCRAGRDSGMRSRSPSAESTSHNRQTTEGDDALDFSVRYNIAERVIKILTPQLKASGRYDIDFGNKVRDTVMAVLAAEYRSKDFYVYLKTLGSYDLLSTISRLLKHHTLYGNMTAEQRSALVRMVEKALLGLVLGGDGRRGGGLCAQHQPFSFAQWANKHGALSLREVKKVDRVVTDPLGVAYDGVKGFIFTGNAVEIVRCTEEGEDIEVLVKDAWKPSAIAIIRCGEQFAFLESRGIFIYDFFTKSKCLFKSLYSHSRGLVFLPTGHLVTACNAYVTAYDTDSNKVSSLPYAEGRRPDQPPSFMSSHGDKVFCTHLNLRRIFIFSLSDGVLLPERSLSLERGIPHSFFYPSGVAADSRKELIICDANKVKGFLVWSSALLDDWRIVKMDKPFPYSAQIAVSPGGTLIAACRDSSTMKLFSFIQEKK